MPIDDGFKIPVTSKRHETLISAFRDRLRLGQQGTQLRSRQWAKNEDTMKAYVKTSENDEERKASRRNGQPQYTTIEVPYSYAMMLTLHTYLTSIFLSRSPILQMQGRHGESQQAEQAVEALLDYQMTSGGNIPVMYVWLLDPLRYGVGVVGQYWKEEVVPVTVKKPVERTFLGSPIPGTQKMETIQELIKGYVGTALYNVRPQDFFPDPRVPVWRFQEGEFVIRFEQIGWNVVRQRAANGAYFNIEEARSSALTMMDRDQGSPRTTLADSQWLEQSGVRDVKGNPARLNVHEFYWEIVPRDYGLGEGELPEKWVFTIANKTTVIGAQPLGMLHNKWPFDVLEYEIGGYELYNRSVLEVAETLNDTLTWLFNSHFFNVRKTLNDQFLVDPSMVEMRDLEDPNPGRLVRLKPAAYGKPVDAFVKQFPTVDVTRQNMSDTGQVADLMQKLLGSNENLMGGTMASRTTATESRSASANAMNRIKTVGEWMSATGFSPMAQKMLQMTQQMYEDERKFRIVGDLSQWGERFMTVSPEQIAGFYDFVPVDGTMPIDRFAQANLWQQIMQGMTKMPQVMAAYDVPKIFAFVAQLAGLKNITQFRIQTVPDAQLLASARAGNSIPIAPGNPAEPGQIPGMGATG